MLAPVVHSISPDIVVLHGGALGDLVLSIHLARELALRGGNPWRSDRGESVHLHLVSRVRLELERPALRISHRSPDGLGLHWLYAKVASVPPLGLCAELHGRRVLCCLGGSTGSVSARLASLEPAQLCCVDPAANPDSVRHITEQWAGQLASQGVLVQRCVHKKRPTGAAHGSSDADRPSRAIVTIHPGSGSRLKCWPLDAFVALARELTRRGRRLQFVVGPAERERWTPAQQASIYEFSPRLCDTTERLVDVLDASAAYVGNDSGPTHLSAFLGIPTVALFGPTDPRVWKPLGPAVYLLRGDPAAPGWALSPLRVADRLEQVLASA